VDKTKTVSTTIRATETVTACEMQIVGGQFYSPSKSNLSDFTFTADPPGSVGAVIDYPWQNEVVNIPKESGPQFL
jgi:hypothetical protein